MPTASSTAPETISAKDLKKQLDAGRPVHLLDVRSPEEHKEWALPNSRNIPLPEIQAGRRPDVPRDATLITFCLHGPRSSKARELLAADGYNVRHLEGGMVAWNSIFDVAPLEAAGARVLQMRRVGKGCMSYLVADAGEALVIDATLDIEAYLEEAERLGARIVRVLDTHAHADHASGSRRLAEATGAKYLAPEEVGADVADEILREGDTVRAGGATLRVLATPGHTPGSLTYLLGDAAFTGDTLFVESVGRPDLGQDPRPNAMVLWKTLHERILALPAGTRILPGHFGEGVDMAPREPIVADLGALRENLPALRMGEKEFADWVAKNALPKPGNFETIKRYNTGQVKLDLDELRDLEAGPNRCAIS